MFSFLFCIILCGIVITPTTVAACSNMVIDNDGGADDAMAISLALSYEKYFGGPKVIGLTTVNGNVNEPQVYINSQIFLTINNRTDIPIYRGSAKPLIYQNYDSDYFFGNDGIGDNGNTSYTSIPAQDDHAALGLIKLSKEYEGNLAVVCIGALTNIALAVSLDPGFIQRLSHLYIGAGNVYSDVYNWPEFNVAMDVEAYDIVTKAATPDKVTEVPYSQIFLSLNVSKEWRTDELGAIPTELMKTQNSFERESLNKTTRWILLDPAVMATVLDDSLVTEYKYSQNSITLCDAKRGLATNNFTDETQANVKVMYAADVDKYQTLLYDIFSAELESK